MNPNAYAPIPLHTEQLSKTIAKDICPIWLQDLMNEKADDVAAFLQDYPATDPSQLRFFNFFSCWKLYDKKKNKDIYGFTFVCCYIPGTWSIRLRWYLKEDENGQFSWEATSGNEKEKQDPISKQQMPRDMARDVLENMPKNMLGTPIRNSPEKNYTDLLYNFILDIFDKQDKYGVCSEIDSRGIATRLESGERRFRTRESMVSQVDDVPRGDNTSILPTPPAEYRQERPRRQFTAIDIERDATKPS